MSTVAKLLTECTLDKTEKLVFDTHPHSLHLCMFLKRTSRDFIRLSNKV